MMDFTVYHNGTPCDQLRAASLEEAQDLTAKSYSLPVVVIPFGASTEERAAACGASIKLIQQLNYGRPLYSPAKCGAAERLHQYAAAQPANSVLVPSDGAPCLYAHDISTVLRNLATVSAALRRANNEAQAALVLLGATGNDNSRMIIERSVRDIGIALDMAGQR